MGWFYRARQFWHALGAQPEPGMLRMASDLLSGAQMALFRGMQPSEQAHALNVLARLLAQGEKQPDLLAAALLHDCGKQLYPLNPLERAWIVVMQKLLPDRMCEWGRVERETVSRLPIWRRPLAVAEQHPAWGAEMARQAGASALLQALIYRHQEKSTSSSTNLEEALLSKLQAVDNES